MARVKALTPYTVSSGAKVRLSEAQRKVRAHVPATETEDGWLIFGGALTFKAGEVIELESVPKGAALDILAEPELKKEQLSKDPGAKGNGSKEEQPPKNSGEIDDKGDSGLKPADTNTPAESDNDTSAENPGVAPAQSELKKDSAVQIQESEAKPAKAGRT